jgi:hypothetical protein
MYSRDATQQEVTAKKTWFNYPKEMEAFLGVKQGCQMICFQTKNPNLGLILAGLAMGNIG